MAQYNHFNLAAIDRAHQAKQINAFNLERSQVAAKRQDEAYDDTTRMQNTRFLAGATKVLQDIYEKDPDRFYAAADELGKEGIQRGIIDPERWDPQLVTIEKVREMHDAAMVGLGGQLGDQRTSSTPAVPAKIQQAEWWLGASTKDRAGYMQANYAGSVKDIGGVPHWVFPGGEKMPLSTREDEIGFESDRAGAIEGAKTEAKAEGERAEEQRTNTRTFNVYETGMRGLVESLGNTTTGPIFGLIPAVTAEQQTAEGAIAAMAPVLKQMFRAAGEGIFTDRDQQLLLDMVPKRTDHPEARVAKVEMIDGIVRAKLGMDPTSMGTDAGGERTATNPQTGERIVFRNGRWEPLQ